MYFKIEDELFCLKPFIKSLKIQFQRVSNLILYFKKLKLNDLSLPKKNIHLYLSFKLFAKLIGRHSFYIFKLFTKMGPTVVSAGIANINYGLVAFS